MNTYPLHIAVPGAGRIVSPRTLRPAGPARPGSGRISGGVRGAGQYCSCPSSARTKPPAPAPRIPCGMMAARGMCPNTGS